MPSTTRPPFTTAVGTRTHEPLQSRLSPTFQAKNGAANVSHPAVVVLAVAHNSPPPPPPLYSSMDGLVVRILDGIQRVWPVMSGGGRGASAYLSCGAWMFWRSQQAPSSIAFYLLPQTSSLSTELPCWCRGWRLSKVLLQPQTSCCHLFSS